MIRGDYGDGETRKERLGANYELVMRIVTQRFNESAATDGRVHVVKRGETLSGIFGADGW